MTPALPILFVGARIVGLQCLREILAAGADVSGLLYLDDAKAGITVAHADFSATIAEFGLNARAFRELKGSEGDAHFSWAKDLRPKIGVVVGVSQLLPQSLLTLPELGFIGMHPAPLPIGRGRAPIPWAIILGLRETGVTWFYADENADTGDILLQRPVPILGDDTAQTLGARTDDVASELLKLALPLLATGTAPRVKQDDSRATTWPKRRPEDGMVTWDQPAQKVYDWVRALTHPYPGAFTFARGRKLMIWRASPKDLVPHAAPGEIFQDTDGSICVAVRDGAIRLHRGQWHDGPEMDASAIGLRPGDHLGAP